MAVVVKAQAGQIWLDDCYYLDRATGECQRKFLLIVAVDERYEDVVTAVFTSKPNGLVESPACHIGPPREGFFVGVQGGVLPLPTWVDFNSLRDLDSSDLAQLQRSSRMRLVSQVLSTPTFCSVLRCVLQCDDLTKRQARLVGDVVESLGCP
jgi:hypothetical protein